MRSRLYEPSYGSRHPGWQGRRRRGPCVHARVGGSVSVLPRAAVYPAIEPVASGGSRPFWSVMIPSYNCAAYLEKTIDSVLAQDEGADRMQIEVVDDCSTTGDPAGVVERVGQGRVLFFRQPRNVGVAANFNACVRRARGKWVHILNDDDYVLPGFYRAYRALIERHPGAAMVIGPAVLVDAADRPLRISMAMASREGPVADFAVRQAVRHWIRSPSVVVRRSVYEWSGGFMEALRHTADWELFFRLGLAGPVVTAVEPHCAYRVHAASDTRRWALRGENIRESVRTIDLCLARLPQEVRRALGATRFDALALYADKLAREFAESGMGNASLRQAAWAFRLRPTWARSRALWRALMGRTLAKPLASAPDSATLSPSRDPEPPSAPVAQSERATAF